MLSVGGCGTGGGWFLVLGFPSGVGAPDVSVSPPPAAVTATNKPVAILSNRLLPVLIPMF